MWKKIGSDTLGGQGEGNHCLSKIQFYSLLAAGGIEFLFFIWGSLFDGIAYYYAESYLIIPTMLFLGATLAGTNSRQFHRQLLLCATMVVWFVITQNIHHLQGIGRQEISMFFCVYLLAFPFASGAQDEAREKGLKAIAIIYIGASMVFVVYTALLLLELLPSFLEPFVKWDGARLEAIWHPNISAHIFLIGILFSLGFFFQSGKIWSKCLLLLMAALQFCCLALTNSRTSIFLTCALIGAAAFFAIRGKGWKRFVLGLAAALAIMIALFAASSALYKTHNTRLVAKYTEQTSTVDAQASAEDPDIEEAVQVQAPKLNAAGQLQGNSSQGTLLNDMRSLNGRTTIWRAAFCALRDNPSIFLYGTEYTSVIISAYNVISVAHAHNSWIEVLFHLGLPGLIIALIFTGIAVWNALLLLWKSRDMWKLCVALLTLCLLANAFLESFLFFADVGSHCFDFIFLLCVGYMTQWRTGGKMP